MPIRTSSAEWKGTLKEGAGTHAEAAKKNCPVSKALTGPQITLSAKML